MKIAILSYWFSPHHIGGSETAIYYYAKILGQKGHEVHVITQLDDKGLPLYELAEGFHVHRIRRWHIPIIGTLLYFLSVYHKIRKLKPDIIQEQAIQGLGFFIKRLLNIPYIVFPRGIDLYQASKFCMDFVVKPTLKNADSLLALTEHMARKIKNICNKEVIIIPNGVESNRFRLFLREDARQKLRINGQEKIILCVAHLRAEKGYRYLIEAMQHVVAQEPEIRLFIVGRDSLNGRIQNMVLEKNLQQKIVFAGFVPPDEVPNYMVAADVFVLPSLGEGFPNVLLEAMAAGLPIVATNIAGVPEIIKDGENGFLVEPRNSQQLTEKILLLLRNEDMRKRFSGNNIEKAKNYDWSTIVTSLEEVYLRVRKR